MPIASRSRWLCGAGWLTAGPVISQHCIIIVCKFFKFKMILITIEVVCVLQAIGELRAELQSNEANAQLLLSGAGPAAFPFVSKEETLRRLDELQSDVKAMWLEQLESAMS
jgi:hypothetical protein